MNGARIRLYSDRIAVVGATESGKSELGRVLFESARCRRMLIDPKHSWRLTGVQPVTAVADIDWTAPLIHVWPPWGEEDFSNELYGAAFRRLRHALLLTDEANGVSDSSWRSTMLAAVQTQGRELEIGHIVLSQRPVNVRREIFTEATHVFLVPPIDDDDLKTARQGFGFVSLEGLRATLNELPFHGYVWLDRREKRVSIGDPLPASMLTPSLMTRRSAR